MTGRNDGKIWKWWSVHRHYCNARGIFCSWRRLVDSRYDIFRCCRTRQPSFSLWNIRPFKWSDNGKPFTLFSMCCLSLELFESRLLLSFLWPIACYRGGRGLRTQRRSLAHCGGIMTIKNILPTKRHQWATHREYLEQGWMTRLPKLSCQHGETRLLKLNSEENLALKTVLFYHIRFTVATRYERDWRKTNSAFRTSKTLDRKLAVHARPLGLRIGSDMDWLVLFTLTSIMEALSHLSVGLIMPIRLRQCWWKSGQFKP
jgi:hypothetical protein